MRSVTPSGQRADDWICTSIIRFTRPVPFWVEPRRRSCSRPEDRERFTSTFSIPHSNRVTERNRTAAKQIHSLSPETSTGPGHSGRSGSRTRKALSYSTGFQPVPVANRVALPFVKFSTSSSPTRI